MGDCCCVVSSKQEFQRFNLQSNATRNERTGFYWDSGVVNGTEDEQEKERFMLDVALACRDFGVEG